MNVLGISALYHDSAAVLCGDGEILAAAQEERFTRKKADASFPRNAIKYCLSRMKEGEKLDAIVYYDNPFLTLDRWLKNCVIVSPNNHKIIEKSFDSIFGKRLWIHDFMKDIAGTESRILVCEHHVSHAASAFYPSPFEEAAIITMDGVGEWATTTISVGKKQEIQILEQLNYPDSLGLLYSAFTYFCGFKVNFGEYKLMGLAPYGEPVYYNKIVDHLINVEEDGSFKLNMNYFAFMQDEVMTDERFKDLFGIKRRIPEDVITKPYMDLAASIQKVTEEIVIKIARHARKITNMKNVVLAGGIALNCVANGLLLREKIFEQLWIQPAAGDAGGALGAALYTSYNYFNCNRMINKTDSQKGSYLGPEFSNRVIEEYLIKKGCKYNYYKDDELFDVIAGYLCENKVIGVLDGRMEFGPRALGGRSIIANPMSGEMQSKLNLKIKYRESFRPFAPSVLKERTKDYFDIDVESPYMLLVAPVKKELREESNEYSPKDDESGVIDLLDVINKKRSSIPAVTHVDYSARIQTVDEMRNPYYYNIIKSFEKVSGCGVIVNTSFNVRGEPIVCTPEDAYLCFMRTDMDVLVMENFVLLKEQQDKFVDGEDWRKIYELD